MRWLQIFVVSFILGTQFLCAVAALTASAYPHGLGLFTCSLSHSLPLVCFIFHFLFLASAHLSVHFLPPPLLLLLLLLLLPFFVFFFSFFFVFFFSFFFSFFFFFFLFFFFVFFHSFDVIEFRATWLTSTSTVPASTPSTVLSNGVSLASSAMLQDLRTEQREREGGERERERETERARERERERGRESRVKSRAGRESINE